MKHAFLIMAHENWELLTKLVKRLDNSSNYIIIHIDAKAKISDWHYKELYDACKHAQIRFIKRQKIFWGGYSIINCEIELFKEALNTPCEYFHLLSGNDYIIKSDEYFYGFFEKNRGKQFVEIKDQKFSNDSIYRYKIWHPFQDGVGRKKSVLLFIEKLLVNFEKPLVFIDRTKKFEGNLYWGGSQWCSITKDFARYLISQEKQIEKLFKYSYCCDEFFLQTIIMNSEYKDALYNEELLDFSDIASNLRLIDWERGRPYTYDIDDLELLTNTTKLFGRKINNDTEKRRLLLDALDRESGTCHH